MFHPGEYQAAQEEAKRHALRAWPDEACGMILHDGRYIALSNVSPEPELHFDCNVERAPFMAQGMVAAMFHSHPYPQVERRTADIPSNFGPSEHDMRQQIADGVAWGLVATDGRIVSEVMFWGDMLPDVPLEGRLFRHGPTGSDGRGDCYALIRDYYRQVLHVDLVEGPRSHDWWHNGGDLYLDNFPRAGFRTIPQEEARVGDVFLAQVQSAVPNHGGVLVGPGVVLHHVGQHLSRRGSLLTWRRSIVRWLRHESSIDPS